MVRKPKNVLKFSKPAGWWGSTWREGLPTGNGVIGASVLGGAARDTVLINHSDLWWQGYVGVLQDVADKISTVRKKVDEGRAVEAQSILSDSLISKKFRPKDAVPLPLVNLNISQVPDRSLKEYSRMLNMESGEVTVSFKDGATRFERSLFVSRARSLIALEITKSGQKNIDASFSFSVQDKFNSRTQDAVSAMPSGVTTKYENRFMYFSARSDNGTEFGAVAVIKIYGGSPSTSEKGIAITGAERVTVLIKPFVEAQRERAWKELAAELDGIKLTYDKLLREHSVVHNKLFSSVELDLDADQRDEFADILLSDAVRTGEMPLALVEKLWAYGRFLTIAGASDASRPLNTYGLWNGDYKAQDSAIKADGSLQACYSHVLGGNLAEHLKSVFFYYESVIADLRKNATRLYECRGIFVPSVMAHGTGVLGSVEPSVIHFTGVAAWICGLFYDYYRFTDDKKFLKDKALPFMKETVSFYENFFKVGVDSFYETNPSFSPDTTPGNLIQANGNPVSIAKNASIDFSLARELIKNLIDGSEAIGANKGDILKWKDMLTRMPKYALTAEGTVKEYIHNDFSDNFTSPSAALFYPIYPGVEGLKMSVELKKAFENTLRKKLLTGHDNFTSSLLIRYANIFARLLEGEAALDLITTAVRAMAMDNLIFAASDWRGTGAGKMDIWATYTIEPNLGITSCVQEMLVNSDSNTIQLLPSLPSKMGEGSITGVLTRTGVEILSMNWNLRKGNLSAKIKSRKSTKIDIILPKGAKRHKQIGKEVFDHETGIVRGFELASGKSYSLDIRF